MIVVDASALVAMAQGEAEEEAFSNVIRQADVIRMTDINYVEAGIVLCRRRLFPGFAQFDAWLTSLEVGVEEDRKLGAAALQAYLRYGKGHHPARLNLADCFAYALAKRLDAPLLYKGDDFSLTDIRSAL